MSKWLAILAYRCEVAGEPTESLDFQVRYFELPSLGMVEDLLRSEAPSTYANSEGESVTWPLAEILTIEEYREPQHGDEMIGFIAQAPTITKWIIPAT